MNRLLAAIRRTWRGLTSAPTLPPGGCAVSRLDRWDGVDPGGYYGDPRAHAAFERALRDEP